MFQHWNRVPVSIEGEISSLKQKRLVYYLGVVIAIFPLVANSFLTVDTQVQNIIHFASFVLLGGLIYPLSSSGWIWVLDRTFIFMLFFASLLLILTEDWIYQRGVDLVWFDWLIGGLVVGGGLEMVRRTTGWIIPTIILLSLSYVVWWGAYIPGVFRFGGIKLETALFRSLFGDDALFGNIARISSTFVFVFIIFGAFLLRSGAGNFIIEISDLLARKVMGGPAIVSIIGSGLTGTISGSAIANTASTGVITIPMMKKAGFDPKFAAGVEAAASTGGQLMPPIMGAGAFVMASYTQIPYQTIVWVSFLPALLYFISLVFYVRIEAFKQGLFPSSYGKSKKESFSNLFRRSGISFVFPVVFLIFFLGLGYTPVFVGIGAILMIVITSWFTPIKLGFRGVMDALALGSRNMVVTAILLCSVGLVINVVTTTGIGNTFSLMIMDWSGHSVIFAVFLIGVASLILGMGLPVTAAYIVLATLSAPALYHLIVENEMITILTSMTIDSLGVDLKTILSLAHPEILSLEGELSLEQAKNLITSSSPEVQALIRPLLLDETRLSLTLLTAHMIIFWLSQDSNVTPPVCLCSFTAATIAKTPPMSTGFVSWKIAKSLYIIPLLFAITPIIRGNFLEMLQTFFLGMAGLYAFSSVIQGWGRFRLTLMERIAMGGFSFLLLYPFAFVFEVAILLFFLSFLFYLGWKGRKDSSPLPVKTL